MIKQAVKYVRSPIGAILKSGYGMNGEPLIKKDKIAVTSGLRS